MKIYNNLEQGTLDWHFKRKGKITGTTLKSLRSARKDTRDGAKYELIAERLTEGVSDEYENAIDRGHRLEHEARTMFEFQTGKRVDCVGFCEHDDSEFIANSPDGLILVDGIYQEAVEIKCPEGKAYVRAWLTNQIPDEYWEQCLQYFVVNKELQKLYFVAYNPEITVHPIHTIELNRADVVDEIAEVENLQMQVLAEIQEELSKVIKL